MALCFGDNPERPQEPVLTAGWSYMRFHFGEDRGLYTEAQLEALAKHIRSRLDEGVDVYAYFNNDAHGYALENAERLCGLLAIAPRLR